VLSDFDTVVLMKVHSVLKNVLPVLKELQLAGNAVYIARVGMPDERIVFDVGTLTPDDLDYFSLLIVRTGRRNA
jgi:precorrin-2/cobalt-factor-2 C20-methyltransferase